MVSKEDDCHSVPHDVRSICMSSTLAVIDKQASGNFHERYSLSKCVFSFSVFVYLDFFGGVTIVESFWPTLPGQT